MPYPFELPPSPSESDNALACVPVWFIPYLRGIFADLQRRSTWATRDGWARAYQVTAQLEVDLMAGCVGDLIAELRALRGLQPGAVIDPEVQYTAATYPGMSLRMLYDLSNRAFNAPLPETPLEDPGILYVLRNFQGTINSSWFGIGGRKATLADIVETLRVANTSQSDSLWDQIRNVLSAGSSAANIATFLQNLLSDTVELGTEGGMLVVLLGMMAANVSMAQIQQAQIQRLINSLDGGGLSRPGDNVLTALRGTVEADATRNVIDKQANNQALLDKLDELIASASISDEETRAVLIQIRDTVA